MDTLYLDSGEGPLELISIDLIYSLGYNRNIVNIGNFSRNIEMAGIFADYEVLLDMGDIVSDKIQHRHQENYAIVVIEAVAVSQIELRQESIDLNRKQSEVVACVFKELDFGIDDCGLDSVEFFQNLRRK